MTVATPISIKKGPNASVSGLTLVNGEPVLANDSGDEKLYISNGANNPVRVGGKKVVEEAEHAVLRTLMLMGGF